MLHNIFVRLKDEWEFEDSDDSDSDSSSSEGEAGDGENEAQDCSGACFQDAIRDRWLLANGWMDDENA